MMSCGRQDSCLVSCLGGFCECDQGLLLHYSPYIKELMRAVTCVCTGPVLILPDITVEVVCLALNLLVGSGGKEVVLEYETLLPAATVFNALGITFTKGFDKIQVSNCVNPSMLDFINILKSVSLQTTAAAEEEERSDEVTHKWF
jgi:hypothetical protein